jgi:hypothetical protein
MGNKVLNENITSKFLPKGKVKTVKGSILNPEYAGLRLILNFVNQSGKPEGSLYSLFDKKWKKVKEETKGWYASRINFKLGEINTIAVQSDTWVINCLCQNEGNSVQETALNDCIKKIASIAKNEKASVHVSVELFKDFPNLMQNLNTHLVDSGINVSVYEEQL